MIDIRKLTAVVLLATLGACAESGDAPTEIADAGAATPVAEGEDACGAGARQALVGTSVGDLDPATLPELRRIIFPGQAVTMDLRLERLNVEIGRDDRIARVYCG